MRRDYRIIRSTWEIGERREKGGGGPHLFSFCECKRPKTSQEGVVGWLCAGIKPPTATGGTGYTRDYATGIKRSMRTSTTSSSCVSMRNGDEEG